MAEFERACKVRAADGGFVTYQYREYTNTPVR